MAASEPGHRGGNGGPHHATVIAWLALFVALGGVANGLQGSNNVGAENIREGAVRAPEIKDGTVRKRELAPDAVTTAAIADEAVGPLQLGPIPAARVDTPAQDPGCATQVIEDGQSEVLQFSIEAFDTQDLHTAAPADCAAGAQSRLTAPVDGVYAVSAQVTWPEDLDGRRTISLLKTDVGGATSIADDNRLPLMGVATQHPISALVDLAVGEFVEIRVSQNAGNELTLTSQLGNHLSMAWLGPLP